MGQILLGRKKIQGSSVSAVVAGDKNVDRDLPRLDDWAATSNKHTILFLNCQLHSKRLIENKASLNRQKLHCTG